MLLNQEEGKYDDNAYVEIVNDYFEDENNLWEHFGEENKKQEINNITNKNNIYENKEKEINNITNNKKIYENIDTNDFNYLENQDYGFDTFEDNTCNTTTNYMYSQMSSQVTNNIESKHKEKFEGKSRQIVSKPKLNKDYLNSQVNNIGGFKQPIEHSDNLCPNYEDYSEDKLKEEIKQYGLKIGSNKSMARQLKEIWEFMNLSI
jgi:hypothetical protein